MKHYPDILGEITGGDRVALNAAQIALALLPHAVIAGSRFQVLLLAQNTTHSHVNLSVSLNLPNRDAKKQRDRFVAPEPSFSARLRPGEVGVVSLPVSCRPDSASGSYKLGVVVTTQAQSQPRRSRPDGPGPAADSAAMKPEHRQAIDKLRALDFVTRKRFGLRDEMEVSFEVLPQQQVTNTTPLQKAQFRSLWNLAEDGTAPMLLAHYRGLIENELFPRLEQKAVTNVLFETTMQRFEAAGYPLDPIEAGFIAKMLGLIVHMANPGSDAYDYLGSQAFNIAVILKHPLTENINLPRWFDGLIRAIAYNEQIVKDPIALICGSLYETLLHDALPFAFAVIQKTTGEDMGTEAEIRAYCESYLRRLRGGMDFGHAYLPLVLGGIIVFDRVIANDEDLADSLRGIGDVLKTREAEWTDDNELVFLLARELTDRSLRLFGFRYE